MSLSAAIAEEPYRWDFPSLRGLKRQKCWLVLRVLKVLLRSTGRVAQARRNRTIRSADNGPLPLGANAPGLGVTDPPKACLAQEEALPAGGGKVLCGFRLSALPLNLTETSSMRN